jgi:HSP20 family protein
LAKRTEGFFTLQCRFKRKEVKMFDLMPWRRREGGDMARFRGELDDLFNRFFDLDIPISRRLFGEGAWAPRVDLAEGKTDITVKAELPGCDAKDIDVSLEGRSITIKGEKKQEKEEKEENYHRIERAYGLFSRALTLPADVDPKKVEASFKDGILKVVLQKTKEAAGKKIEIKTG